jgi:hypothetical protein
MPRERVRGFYEVVAVSIETSCAFQNRGVGTISSGPLEVPDASYLLKMAKCTIDFLLEEPY